MCVRYCSEVALRRERERQRERGTIYNDHVYLGQNKCFFFLCLLFVFTAPCTKKKNPTLDQQNISYLMNDFLILLL